MNKRKDGRLEKTITLDGKRIHVYGHSQAEIKMKIDQLYRDMYDGRMGIDRETKFKDYAAHWLDVYLPGKAENTQASYRDAMRHMVDEVGEKRLCTLKRSEIEKALINHNDTPTMRNKMLSVTSLMYNMAIDDGIVVSNPTLNIKKEKILHKDRHIFSDTEVNMYKGAELSQRDRLVVDILYHTGIRKGELLALSRKSIGKGVIYIREQSQDVKGGSPTITKLKTHHGLRDIPIPDFLEDEIRDYLKTNDDIYMFQSIRNRNCFYRMWRDIMVAFTKQLNPNYDPQIARIKMDEIPVKLKPHDFRHNYASILHAKGFDVKVAQYLLGHASLNTTLAIYTHLSKATMDENMEKVRNMWAV